MVYRQVIVLIKRTFYLLIFLFFLCSVPVFGQNMPQVSAASAILYDPLDGSILFAKNAEEQRGMASTTKIMTALVALEQYDLTNMVAIRPEWCGIEGSSMYLKAGETLLVSDLLYGLLLASGNDAATALAGMDPGGTEAFVSKMNAKAAELGLVNTHFQNPSGLDGESHYTTALELAKLTAYGLQNPEFAKIVSTESQTVAGRVLTNHNRLLREIGACGVKTGFTKSCGRCLASAKTQNGRMLICVTLNAANDWSDHQTLYEFGFSQYAAYDLLGAGDCGSVSLISSEKSTSRLYCNESFSMWLTPEEQEELCINLCGPRFWYGATQAGETYGSMQIRLGDQVVFETPVYFADSSAASVPEPSFLQKWMNFLFRRRER